MKKQYDAIVVGGGYFGCAAAYYLSKAGVKTLLLEEKEITRGASGANFGNVQVQDASMGLSYELTLKGWYMMEHMEEELGCEIGYSPMPSTITAEKPEHIPELEKVYREKKEAGLDIRWVEGKELYDLHPGFKKGSILAATYFVQGRIWPFAYMYACVRKGREEYGLDLAEGKCVSELLMEGSACRGVMLSDGNTIRADHVILAAGAGTRALGKTAGLDIPVYTCKAECFVTETVEPFFPVYYSTAAFFAEAHSQEATSTSLCFGQSIHGNLLLAETTKPYSKVEPQYDDCISPEHCRNIHRIMKTMFEPSFMKLNILRSWTTSSPYTETCLPCFGKSVIPGLILDAGFKSSAVMSAISGTIVTDLVTKDACDYDLSEFTGQVKLVRT